MKFVNYKTLFGAIFIIITVLILKNTVSELVNIQQKGSVVQQLENELEQKQNQNKFLQEQLKYVQNDDFIEKEARNRLGYVKANEAVVLKEINPSSKIEINTKILKPNWKLWLELFI